VNGDVERNPPGWKPPGLWAPFVGHLTVNLLKLPIIVGIAWILMLLVPAWGPARVLLVVVGAVVLDTAFAAVAVVIERPFLIRGRLIAPGGWDFALFPWLGASAVVFAMALGWFGAPRGIVLASVISAVEAAFVIWMREWIPGETDTEYAEKWRKTKDMTKELFAPDVAEIRRIHEERVMEGYRRKIAEREAERRRQADGSPPSS
jgi:hypothetical protein